MSPVVVVVVVVVVEVEVVVAAFDDPPQPVANSAMDNMLEQTTARAKAERLGMDGTRFRVWRLETSFRRDHSVHQI